MKPFLSIIIPIKKIEKERFLILLNSIFFLKTKHNVEVIIIYSEYPPQNLLIEHGFATSDIIFDFLEPNGIYNAFNYGISKSSGQWVMFFGGDDFLLPSFNELLSDIESNKFNHSAIVCNVIFGDKIFKPFKSKYGLIFKNWCQQGVLYNRLVFRNLKFDENYPIQADHKFNIEICNDQKFNIKYYNKVIAYFNTNGISQNVVDRKFRSDFPSIVKSNFGLFFGILTYIKRELSNVLKKQN